MLGIRGVAALSDNAYRASVAGLGPRRKVSRRLKAACPQSQKVGHRSDPNNLPYISWLENTVDLTIIQNWATWRLRWLLCGTYLL